MCPFAMVKNGALSWSFVFERHYRCNRDCKCNHEVGRGQLSSRILVCPWEINREDTEWEHACHTEFLYTFMKRCQAI
jgi:hypothetical protein